MEVTVDPVSQETGGVPENQELGELLEIQGLPGPRDGEVRLVTLDFLEQLIYQCPEE